MFLSHRAAQAEYFDAPDRTAAEVADGYRLLARVNRLFHFAEPFQRHLPRWLGAERCRSLSLLDLGAGDGSLGRALTAWAGQRGWSWRVTSLDLNPLALRLNPGGHNVAACALALPFADRSFDVVIASQMTHHLAPTAAVARHFREAWRVTRDTLFLNDLHRNGALLAVVWLATHLTRLPAELRSDGLLSVRRGWRLGEWRRLAEEAGIPDARVWLHYGARIMLRARKTD